ncbi:MAG TPA: sigma-70 family RNA polymerase sigma factor [Pirellulales bacterium]|jgi:RNA polymerase sigma-70 factor (ECF subfamily)|nr:sigma-70 family RNA polymerase sigma factor [Pirellulales bacterium]
MADDADLATRAAAGDRDAAGEIYDRYAPLVRAILLDAAGSWTEANDLVQEVFLRAFGRLGQLRRPELLCGWLMGIARREAANHRRHAARGRRLFTPLVDEPADDRLIGGPGDARAVDAIDDIRQAIRELPERERIAIHVHYLCGETVEVARQVLGLSPAGFYKLLERARGRLAASLQRLDSKR